MGRKFRFVISLSIPDPDWTNTNILKVSFVRDIRLFYKAITFQVLNFS